MSDSLHPAFADWFRGRCPEIPVGGARAVLALAAEGAPPPFIARYRKELTGNLDEASVRRTLETKALFDRILSRQAIVVDSIERHSTLSAELRERILGTFDLDVLEDLYHPYRQQKKNRALVAREAGLQQLADWIWDCGHGTDKPQEGQTLELWAFTFRNEEKGVADAKAAIEGARDILVERLAGDPELRALVRRAYFEAGYVRSTKTDQAKAHSKFESYFAFSEKVGSLQEAAGSGRYLTLRRGQSEGELQVAVSGPPDDAEFEARLVASFEAKACTVPDSPGAEVLRHAGRIAFKNDVRTSIENEVHRVLKEAADAAAAQVFAEDVRRLLTEPPFGPRPVLGVDPARTGCKLVTVDAAGAFAGSEVVFLQTDEQKSAAADTFVRLVRERGVAAVAVGNGAGGRETEIFARAALRQAGLELPVLLVSEAGASSYASSEAAKAEFPELDPGVRAAISIARRLQDPLAELVKLEPRSIGVGQYQHDVAPAALRHALDTAIESCVNGVGVNLNTASRPLLAHVAGIGPARAAAIVEWREKRGPFRSRRQLLEVPGVGAREFELAAGFLRVADGDNPLDNTAVHPERYPALEAFAARLGRNVGELVGPGARLVREATELKDELGACTWEDVAIALEKPGHDPRGVFVPFLFREDVQKLEDLKPGMTLPGIVNNVTSFGAFVDIGVHQDGLVHVSQLGKSFVKEPREVVRPGDHVQARVLKVDLEKKQVSLSLRPAPKPERGPTARRVIRREKAATGETRTLARPSAQGEERASRPPARRGSGRKERRPSGVPSTLSTGAPPAAEGASDRRPGRERPMAPRSERPARPVRSGGDTRRPTGRPPEPRRPAFNNPFAVLASLKTKKS